MKKNNVGFTLVELLIVIAVIAILAALALVALNPLARFQDTRNARRWADVNAIASAIKLYQVDHGGIFVDVISNMMTGEAYQIGQDDTGSCADVCPGFGDDLNDDCVDLDTDLSEVYIPDVPIDPNASGVSADKTGYYVLKNESGIITVGSCYAELGTNSSIPDISVRF